MDFYYSRLIAFQQVERLPILKKYLNLLVKPNPNLPINNVFDIPTERAIRNFKKQFNRLRGLWIVEDGTITVNLWRFIYQELQGVMGGVWVKEEINNLRDVELINLLLGVPSSEYTESISSCDKKLAELFGGKGAIVMSIVEPKELKKGNGSPRDFAGKSRGYGHNAIPCNELVGTNDRGGIIHIYANEQGLSADVDLYVPAGFKQIYEVKVGNHVEKLLPKEDNQKYFYSDAMKLYIVFSHVKTDGVIRIGTKKANGSVKIGNVGGPRGYAPDGSYFHTHIAFFSEYFGHPFTGTRVDPRDYFCK